MRRGVVVEHGNRLEARAVLEHGADRLRSTVAGPQDDGPARPARLGTVRRLNRPREAPSCRQVGQERQCARHHGGFDGYEPVGEDERDNRDDGGNRQIDGQKPGDLIDRGRAGAVRCEERVDDRVQAHCQTHHRPRDESSAAAGALAGGEAGRHDDADRPHDGVQNRRAAREPDALAVDDRRRTIRTRNGAHRTAAPCAGTVRAHSSRR